MPKVPSLSPWQQFKQKWQNCSMCSLCEVHMNIVLCKGKIPCDVLFVGEAPGASEDVLGQPFVGPAGHLLDQQIEAALDNCPGVDLRMAFTNLVCCIPKEGGKKIGEPSKESIKACEPRLLEFIELCQPKKVVCVGDLPTKYAEGWGYETTKITHPAAILRAEIVRQSLMHHRVIVILENVFREV